MTGKAPATARRGRHARGHGTSRVLVGSLHHERRAPVGSVGAPDVAAVVAHRLLHDAQAEAAAGADLLAAGAREPLEDPRPVRRWHAGSAVLHVDVDELPAVADRGRRSGRRRAGRRSGTGSSGPAASGPGRRSAPGRARPPARRPADREGRSAGQQGLPHQLPDADRRHGRPRGRLRRAGPGRGGPRAPGGTGRARRPSAGRLGRLGERSGACCSRLRLVVSVVTGVRSSWLTSAANRASCCDPFVQARRPCC